MGSVVGAYAKVSIPGFTVLETYPTLNSVVESVQGGGVRVNPVDADEVMYTRPSYGDGGDSGIFLIGLDGSNNRRLR